MNLSSPLPAHRLYDEGVMSTLSSTAAFDVRIQAVTRETEDIISLELVDPRGRDLPEFSAGAHLDVHIAEGLVRQYSLSNDPAERRRYQIAVLNEPAGRGGSKALHEKARPGATLSVSAPRNHFPLANDAKRHLLLAGGIGVTPMMAMIATLTARGDDWRMHYCTRSAEKTAFRERLKPFIAAGNVILHHDGGDPKKGLDIAAALKKVEPGTHLYYCGPSGFMAAVAAAAKHWPDGSVHFEFFNSPATLPAETRPNTPFQVKLKSTGEVLDIPADKSIVQVLRDNGRVIDTSCEEGYCGTCLTRYVEGQPEHRDTLLDADDSAKYVVICCARSILPMLVLDI